MPNAANYDPVKAHEYYERTKQLKGRKKGSFKGLKTGAAVPKIPEPGFRKDIRESKASAETVARLKTKVDALSKALSEARQVLSEKRAAARETEKDNSDGKSTEKEKQASKEYRDKNKAEIAAKRKSETSSESSGPGGYSSMSIEDLTVRISNIQSTLSEAKRQLTEASRAFGHFAHADFIDSDLKVNDIMLLHSTSRKDAAVETADFGGYATRNNLRCSDGRIILAGAFDQNDGDVVPLVWQHGHDEPTNVLGHAKLEKRDDGTYCHAYFNATAAGQHAKEMVKHGDVKFLSIWANQLVERVTDAATRAKDVIKGNIREVSLVLGGANPGAYIDNVAIAHGDGEFAIVSDEAYIFTGLEIETAEALSHAETVTAEAETVQDVLDTLTEKQQNAVNYLVSQALLASSDDGDDDSIEHSDTEGDDVASSEDSSTTESVEEDEASTESEGSEELNGSEAPNDADTNDGSNEEEESTDSESSEDSDDSNAEVGAAVQHQDNQEDNSMTHNVFDQARGGGQGHRPQATLSHDDIKAIVDDAKRNGSLKQAVENFIVHNGVTIDGQLQHGIENIEYLFPDAKALENSPQFVSRRMEWVNQVLGSVRKSPFSRIKSITADITPDEARARGYVKGNLKNEEFFEMSKRETTPQTIYKKQKLDRDDVIDIVDLDVVSWLKAEMKVMLDEELAGAILCADGRSNGHDDKIIETKIRPIATDAELYVTTAYVNLADNSSSIEELVDAAIAHRRYYKGSGTPTFYTTENVISSFLTVKDNFGRRLYSTLQDIAAVLRVKEIVPVEVMERDSTLVGIMVNLSDYTLGADKGGMATMFDDFDLDYNKLIYLIETRVSGALTMPKSALVFRSVDSGAALVAPTAPAFDGDAVTVPTITGVTYHQNTSTGTVMTTGSPVSVADGVTLHVVATPASSSYYFANNVTDEWDFTGTV
jgi:HK97 family phage prohead protease